MEREVLSAPGTGVEWPRGLTVLLDSYLRKVGIAAAEVRARWVEHVLSGLTLHIDEFAADDIVELAVERLRDAIDNRLARIANLDPVREGSEVAAILVVLQAPRYSDLVHALFDGDEFDEVAPDIREQLRLATAADRPRPVPADAPLEVPIQRIELRSLQLVKRLFGGPVEPTRH